MILRGNSKFSRKVTATLFVQAIYLLTSGQNMMFSFGLPIFSSLHIIYPLLKLHFLLWPQWSQRKGFIDIKSLDKFQSKKDLEAVVCTRLFCESFAQLDLPPQWSLKYGFWSTISTTFLDFLTFTYILSIIRNFQFGFYSPVFGLNLYKLSTIIFFVISAIQRKWKI